MGGMCNLQTPPPPPPLPALFEKITTEFIKLWSPLLKKEYVN